MGELVESLREVMRSGRFEKHDEIGADDWDRALKRLRVAMMEPIERARYGGEG